MNWLAQATRIAISGIITATVALAAVSNDATTETCAFFFQIPTLISLTHVAGLSTSTAGTSGVGGDRTANENLHLLLSTLGCSVSTSILVLSQGSHDWLDHPDGHATFTKFCGYVPCREQVVQPRVSAQITLESLEIAPHKNAIILCTVTID